MAVVLRRVILAATEDFVQGCGYVYGAKPDLYADPWDGMVADCSGAITRWFARAGVTEIGGTPIAQWHGSWKQRVTTRAIPNGVALALGRHGRGLLLFMLPKRGHPGHVALSFGNGTTIECRSRHGVCFVDNNTQRPWDVATKPDEIFRTD